MWLSIGGDYDADLEDQPSAATHLIIESQGVIGVCRWNYLPFNISLLLIET